MNPVVRRFLWLLTALVLAAPACSDDSGGNNGGADTDLQDGGTDAADAADAGDTDMDSGDAADGGDGSSQPGEVVTCDNTLDAPPSGRSCSTTSGSSSLIMLQGEVLAGDTIYKNGQVLIDRSQQNATISCVGCDCGDEPDANTATVVSCPASVISPGLINAHEHLGWSTGSPKSHGDERYEHRHDWRRGLRGHTEIRSGGSDYSTEAVLFGELRHMLSGATSIAGSGGSDGFLRNVDRNAEGVDANVDYSTFPLGDSDGTLLDGNCGYPGIDSDSVLTQNEIYLPHVSEGIDGEAENEFGCLASSSNGGTDLIEDNTSIIHGIGLTAADIAEFAANGGQLVWSPRTNIDLYGNTADVVTYDNYGVPIALGTDWVLSGSMNMLRELQCVDYLNQNHYGAHFSDRQLWKMATENGALALGVGDELGKIADGYVADIAIFDATDADAYRAVLSAGDADVQLVMRGGEALIGEPNIVQALVPSGEIDQCESISICDGARLICAQRDTGYDWSTIVGAANGNYEPFYCDQPANEPSCVPARTGEYDGMSTADDQDGDGIADADDLCPTVFDPSRPLDGDTQPDYDGDGIGDACDTCPLSDGETCEPFDPNDRDSDGVANDQDNCPAMANADQLDADADDIGDVCDPCPDFANPGNTGCPATIYEVWSGDVAVGEKVLISDAVVTAVNQPAGDSPQGIFIQYASDSDDFSDVPHSGIYVYMPDYSPFPARGDRIDISAVASEYGGSKQLDTADSVTVNSSNNTLPAPVTVDPADIATGGADADTYLNVLVRVDSVDVTDANPDGPSNDYNEFAVDGGLRVDDLLYLITPDPQVGDHFDALIGPLYFSFGNSKIVPRDDSDVILGPPALSALTPSMAYLEAGATGVPTPGLTVELTHAPAADLTVDLSYSDSSVVDGPATVTVPAGQKTADLSLTAGASAAGSTADVTATLGSDSLTSSVMVYDDATARAVASLTPAAQTVQLNQTATLTVTLDVPAPSGGQDVTVTTTAGVSAPGTVTVPAGAMSTAFTVTAGGTAGTDTVTAAIGGSSQTADITLTAGPSTPCLIISEYVEGSSYNKGLELYNCSSSDMELSDFGICLVSNGDTSCSSQTILPAGTLASDEVYTVCNSQASMTCDTSSGVINHNGNDRYFVFKDDDASGSYEAANDTITDAFGEIAVDPGDAWKDKTYLRCDFMPYYGQGTFNVLDYYTEQAKDYFGDFGTKPTQGCN